jgi:hypothetical protein
VDRCVADSRPVGDPSEDDRYDKAEVRQFTDRNAGAREHDRRR